MVDEAHSLGVLGSTGRGIRESFDLVPGDVDIWMGTLSKTLAGCGGYIAGSRALVENLRYLAPGFLYSVGMAAPLAAASCAAIQILKAEPERVRILQDRGKLFLSLAKAAGIDTGHSAGLAIVPAILHSSIKATQLSNAMFHRGISVHPIVYPAVPEKSARLRFFLSCLHSESDVRITVRTLAEEISKL